MKMEYLRNLNSYIIVYFKIFSERVNIYIYVFAYSLQRNVKHLIARKKEYKYIYNSLYIINKQYAIIKYAKENHI